MDDLQLQIFFEYLIEYYGPEKISEVPPKFRSLNVWKAYLKKGGEFCKIPKKYKTRELYEAYSEIPGSRFNFIPDEYLTQEMCDKYINKGGNVKLVPTRFQNFEMCVKYLNNGGEMKNVPTKFQNQELWNIYVKNGGKIDAIPNQYRSQYIYSELAKKGDIDIASIPDKYLNQEIVNEYVKKVGNISFVPKKYLNQELVNFVIQQKPNVAGIPEEYLTQEMCDKYIEMGGRVENVPKTFQTVGMWTQRLLRNDRLDFFLPAKFNTQELWNQFIEKGGDIQIVPKKFLNDDLCNKYIELGGSSEIVSSIRENDMIDIDNETNEELLYQLKEYFKSIDPSEITRNGMLEYLNVSGYAFTKLLQFIEVNDAQLYNDIIKIFKINKNKHFSTYIGFANKIEELLKTINYNYELSKEQKIYFSYLYDQLGFNKSIMELYRTVKEQRDIPMFLSFCENELGYYYLKLKDDEISLSDEEYYLMNNKGNWFSKFNVNDRINSEGNKSVRYKYLTKYNDQVEIKKSTASMIMDYLKENNVSTRVCVVEEAFRRYANGELENFVYDLQSGEYLNINRDGIKNK